MDPEGIISTFMFSALFFYFVGWQAVVKKFKQVMAAFFKKESETLISLQSRP